jgi:tRNA(Arg) A34 adenosine deaminase TadA
MENFSNEEIEKYMKEAFKQCEKAIKETEIPVGCIFLHIPSKKILIESHNLTNKTRNASSHCEINCINYLEKNLPIKINDNSYFDLKKLMNESALFVSCEPCIMCAYALSLINIKEVYFGCSNDKFGGNGSIVSIHKFNLWTYKSEGGFSKNHAIQYLRQFYSVGNKKAPENKRQRKLISEK